MSCDIEATIDQRPIDVEVQGAIVAMDLADGDYGDIVVSNNGATMTIENMGENATVTTGTYVSKVNQDLLIKVRKASAGTITKGQAVYIVGSTGNHLSVELARADAEATSAYTIGIAATTITNTTDGFVIQNGRLTGLSTVPTANFADGDAIYLSETTAGAYRVGLPQAPNHGVFLGFVIKANNGNAGEIDIRIDNYQELEELSDVYINNETTNDFLVRKATRWENTTSANVKTILAIDNVDNTSDANKPISTATQTALNAKVNKSGDTMTGALVNSTNGAVSTPPMSLTGSWYNGGTSTTTKPQVLIEPTGTTSNTWSTAGTGLGVNAPSGFTGNLATFGINGTERMRITATGNVGIGTTTPGVLLEVNGAMTAQGNIFAASGGATRTITLGPAGAGLEYNIDGTTYLGGRTDAYPLVFRTNSAERMRVTATGNVGIATASPVAKLEVKGSTLISTTNNGNNILGFNDVAFAGGTLNGAPDGASGSAFIVGNGSTSSGAPSYLSMWTTNGGVVSERMRITSTGNVGIGITTPQSRLDVAVGSTAAPTVKGALRVLGGSTVAEGGIELLNSSFSQGYGWRVFAPDLAGGNTPLVFSARNNSATWTERVRIDTAGNVGIGTASPADTLHINGGYIRIQRDTPQIFFRSADGASNQYYIGANISDVVDGGFVIGEGANLSSGTPRITINGAGNVGIGTASPSQLLSITTASNDDGILLTNSSANGGRLRLSSTGTGGRSYHVVSTANGSGAGGGKFVVFDNTASDAARLVIDSSGNLGIGTASPTVKLEVNGQIRTEAPTGGTAANWRLGTVHTVTPTSPNRTIEVDIGGTIYYIHAKTTNN